jgi:hypothetical protein
MTSHRIKDRRKLFRSGALERLSGFAVTFQNTSLDWVAADGSYGKDAMDRPLIHFLAVFTCARLAHASRLIESMSSQAANSLNPDLVSGHLRQIGCRVQRLTRRSSKFQAFRFLAARG